MYKLSRIPAAAVLSAALLLSLSTGAQAGGDRYYRGGHEHGHAHSYKHYSYDRHSVRPRYRYKRHHNSDDQLLIGLLVGGLVGYAINNTRPREVVQYDSYPPATVVLPPPQQTYPATSYGRIDQHETCLQEREYQTTVTVGGRQVDAYGTACLQPDGSWRRSPAQAAYN